MKGRSAANALPIFCFALAALHVAPPVEATPILDQSFDAPSFLNYGFGGDIGLAQTFTVGVTGVLTQVDVEIRRDAGIPDLLLDIRPTIEGVPVASDADALASFVIPSAGVPTDAAFLSTDLSAAQIAVSLGDVLAIVLRAPGPGGPLNYSWQGSISPPLYGSGSGFFRGGGSPVWFPASSGPTDFSFQTFVEPAAVPEPSTLLLFLLGISAMGVVRKKTHSRG
jgi:hypothetical protein